MVLSSSESKEKAWATGAAATAAVTTIPLNVGAVDGEVEAVVVGVTGPGRG